MSEREDLEGDLGPSPPAAEAPPAPVPSSSPSATAGGGSGLLFRQAWRFSVLYLALGLGLELARRLHFAWAARMLEGLDRLLVGLLQAAGLLSHYLDAVLGRTLPPLAERLLLFTAGLVAIGLLSLATGAILLMLGRLFSPHRGRTA